MVLLSITWVLVCLGKFVCLGVVARVACARRSRRSLMSPSSELRGTCRVYGSALRGQNRPRQLRRSQAVNGEESSNLSVPCGLEVATATREDFHSS